MDYKKKYLKYKLKYLNAKKSYGGENSESKVKKKDNVRHEGSPPSPAPQAQPAQPAQPPAQPAPQTALPLPAGPGHPEVPPWTPALDLIFKKALLRPQRPLPKCELKNTSKSLLDIILNFFSLNKNVDIGRKLTDFIARKGDICCLDERNIEKEKAIKVLYQLYYESYDEGEELNWLINNIILLIPKKLCYYNANGKANKEEDEEGIEIEKILDDKVLKNNKVDKDKFTALLNELPLYFILTIIGSEIVTREKNLYYL